MYTIDDLLYLMERLRSPEHGCPWDLAQTAESIINYSLEEVYELAEAIEQQDSRAVRDELGDVLFQVIFLARIAKESEQFDFSQVVDGLCSKMLRRHPHVFPAAQLYPASPLSDDLVPVRPVSDSPVLENVDAGLSGEAASTQRGAASEAAAVAKSWDSIKRAERDAKQLSGLFDDVPLALPATLRAKKLQKRAATIGLDWPDEHGALASLRDELGELEQAMAAPLPDNEHATDNDRRVADELGDVLFSCVNVARKLGLDPEQCLRKANHKFIQRAEFVQQHLARPPGDNAAASMGSDRGSESPGNDVSAAEINALWELSKQRGL